MGRAGQKARFRAWISGEPDSQSTQTLLERVDHTFSYKMLKISSKYLAWIVNNIEKCNWPFKGPRMPQGYKNWDALGVNFWSLVSESVTTWRSNLKPRTVEIILSKMIFNTEMNFGWGDFPITKFCEVFTTRANKIATQKITFIPFINRSLLDISLLLKKWRLALTVARGNREPNSQNRRFCCQCL